MKKNFLYLLLNQRGEILTSPTGPTVSDLPASEPASATTVTPDTVGMSSDQIKEKITGQKPPAPKAGTRIPVSDDNPKPVTPADPAAPAADPAKPGAGDPWFKQMGFPDEATAIQSTKAAQEKIRQQAEELKQFKTMEQSRVQEELQRLRALEAERNLSPDEKAQREAFTRWEKENADALKLIEQRLVGKLQQDFDIKPKAEQFQQEIAQERKAWKDAFDKEKPRAELWPIMETLYKEKAEKFPNGIFDDFGRNPLPYVEAMAFQKDFPRIAERIRAEAIEQYKADVKKAEAAAKGIKTGIPGGAKSSSADVDVAGMSSKELGNLLPRSENG